MKKLLAGLALGTLLIGAAIAQPYVYPQVTSVSPTDLIQDLPLGQPVGPSNQYTTAALINNVPGYQKSTPLTAFTLTFKNGQSLWYITPAGTLATGTFTMAPAPGDGAVACAEIHPDPASSDDCRQYRPDHRWDCGDRDDGGHQVLLVLPGVVFHLVPVLI